MLQHLTIENYALIESLDIHFSEGFSAITGETGAGKSIILGALGLILGQRADVQSLLDKEHKCVIEGTFDVRNLGLSAFFTENDLDEDDYAILRREIAPTGKSRAFINDTPVSLQQMKTIGERLVDIHSQHQTLTLGESSFQLQLVDIFMENTTIKQEYSTLFVNYCSLKTELEQLKEDEARYKTESDYIQFLFNELQEANLKQGEQEELENELNVLTHAETIKSASAQIYQILEESEYSVNSQLAAVKNLFSKIASYHTEISEFSKRFESCFIELKDIGSEIGRIEEGILFSAESQEAATSRLDLIYRLEKKHNLSNIGELLEVKCNLDEKLQSMSSLEEKIVSAEKELNTLEQKLSVLADKLSKQRHAAALVIEKQIKPVLAELGMPNAVLKIDFKQLPDFTKRGKDAVSFLFNANLGGQLSELAKAASGGELSRLMLAVKSLVTKNSLLPTIIFDEIDSGVSGEISGKVGNIMLQMSKRLQVISITHLPQIAAKADTHFKVFKQSSNSKTVSLIKQLSDNERVEEIAKMLSSDNVSQAAIDTAKELMK